MRGGRFSGVFEDPVFVSKYKERWNEKYNDISSISAFIDTMFNQLKLSASLNSSIWEPDDYAFEIGRLKTWWNTRVTYLNTAINSE